MKVWIYKGDIEPGKKVDWRFNQGVPGGEGRSERGPAERPAERRS